MQVVVLGAGIVGLVAAHAVRHRGHDVAVLTKDAPLATTSAAAGASFKPRLVAESPELGPLLWASRDVLADWTRSGFAAAVGIRRHRHVVATAADRLDLPHLSVMDDVTWSRLDHGDVVGDVAAGARIAVAFTTWFFEVETTLEGLVDHLAADHDVAIRRGSVRRLAELADEGDLVVNATGAAAGGLVEDPDLVPIRGQVVRVRSPRLADWSPDRSIAVDGAYVYPRPDGLLVGGTADWGEHDTVPVPRVARRLVDAATRLAPALAEVTDDDWVSGIGLRPYRHGGVRVERGRDVAGTPVVHAYGHGGAGWTLAAGTAERVADLVEEHAARG